MIALVACAPTTPRPVTGPITSAPPPDLGALAPKSFVQHGLASYYADQFHGKLTASGEPMDQTALTAASKQLPLGTLATVTNLETGKSVRVEVNDRGPYVPGRIIDVSRRAATILDMHEDGISKVRVEAVVAEQPTAKLRRKIERMAKRQAVREQRGAQAHDAEPSDAVAAGE
jgi:rare lipoprotein A